MNKIDLLFSQSEKSLLSIYVTAGFPHLDSLKSIVPALEHAGVDFVEIGMPFSDPLADGPVIQKSSQLALENGMNLRLLFRQLEEITTEMPLILMGYINPVLQFGMEKFLRECRDKGISGTILPDLPIEEYFKYQNLFEKYGIYNILLVTPQTSPDRVKYLAEIGKGFLYLVSSASTTGTKGFAEADPSFFQKIKEMKLRLPAMIGFGIQTPMDFKKAGSLSRGAIIGSKFIELLGSNPKGSAIEIRDQIDKFVNLLRT